MNQFSCVLGLDFGGMVVGLAMACVVVGCNRQSAPQSTSPSASQSVPQTKDFSTAYTATVMFGDQGTESGDGLQYISNAGSPASLTELAGVPCRQYQGEPSRPGYLYFAFDPTFKKGTLKHFRVLVEFFDSQPGVMTVQFDGGKTWKISNAAYTPVDQSANLSGKKLWKTAPFDIYDATFKNAQNSQADFRLELTASEVYIRRVTVERVEKERHHGPGLSLQPGLDFSGTKVVSLPLGTPDLEADQGLILNTTERDGRSAVTNLDGIPCRFSTITNKLWAYLYFAIHESFKDDLQDVDITVECLAPHRTPINLEFDGSKRRDVPSPTFAKPGPDIWLAGSTQWQTNVFRVRNATFENKQNGGSDFRLLLHPGTLCIRRITATRPTPPGK